MSLYGQGMVIYLLSLLSQKSALQEIIAATERGNKYLPQFSVNVVNAKNEVVAQVNRTLYVRKKPQYRSEMIYQPGDIKLDRTD